MKGSHNFSFGGSFTRADIWAKNQATVPTITFGVETVDPAFAMFNTTNFPGAGQDGSRTGRAATTP